MSRLKWVALFATIGEYNAAAEELGRFRLVLHQNISKSFIKGNVAQIPAYGVSLVNPDEKKWRLSIEEQGAIKILQLKDRWSLKEEYIEIAVIDLVLAHGPQVARVYEDEEMAKQSLITAGRAGAATVGSDIEQERFILFKGNSAYEAIIKSYMPGVKVKGLWMTPRPGFMLIIFMQVDSNTFQEKIAEFDKIIQGDWLQIGD